MRPSVEALPVELGPVVSLLDVGCGIRPADFIECRRYVGVDAHQPYIDRLANHPGEFICSGWRAALERFADDEFSLIVGLDFIEHLEAGEGMDFLTEAQRAGRTVAIFTPSGPFPQDFESGKPDQWGMDGAEWQTHRSAWTPAHFEALGWAVYVLEGFHTTDARGNTLPAPIDAFWGLWPCP